VAPAASTPDDEPGATGGGRWREQTSLLDALSWAEEGLVAAEESCWRVLAVFERSLGSEHSEVASIHRRLADAHQGRGRFAEAEAHLRKALAVRTAALGVRHPATAADEAALGQLLVTDGRFEEAEALLRRALRTFQLLLGRRAPETVVVSRQLLALGERRGPELTASRTAVQ
jgi:tetratricopeptide (TPR) repeat protein